MSDLNLISPPIDDGDVPRWLADIGVDNLTDMHVHFLPDRVLQKVWRYFDQGEERFGKSWPIWYRFDEETRVQTLCALGVRNFVPLTYPHKPDMAMWLNSWVRDFTDRTPGSVLSATLFPEPSVQKYLTDALDGGVRCIKVHIPVGGFDPRDPLLTTAWGLISDAAVPVVIHCGHGLVRTSHTGLDIFAEVLAKHPDLTVVLAHAGMPEYLEALTLVERYDNVYIDTTLVGTQYMKSIAPLPDGWPAILADSGVVNRVVFGTDYPNIPYAYVDQLKAIYDWACADSRLGVAFLRSVLQDTPRRLLKL